jgi:hypothetical protein
VPDQGFLLSSDRTAHPLSVKLTTVIASSALALGAAATAAASSALARPPALPAPAHPTTAHLTTGHLTTAHLTTGRPAAAPSPRSIRLTTMLTPAAPAAARKLTPRQIARQMLGSFGWSQRQFPYLNWLWDAESGWSVYAENPYSGAYGIPQADPGAKMATAGPDWPANAATQIRWGLRYIRSTYGSPRLAWEHEVADGWY